MVSYLGIWLKMIGMPSRRTSDANYKWDGRPASVCTSYMSDSHNVPFR